jgi:hypothetical protein
MTIEHKAGANNFRIAAVLLLPGAIAEHGSGRCRGLIVSRQECSAGKGLQTEGGKVIAAHILTPQRLGLPVHFTAPHAQLQSAGLKGGHLLELRGGRLKTLVQLVGINAPAVILWATFHAAVVAITDAVETGWIDHRQRLEHDGVDQREDRGGCADAQGEG